MNKTDIEHKLLKGGVIYLGEIPTYRVTLGQMVDFKYGYSWCQQLIRILCMDDYKTDELLNDTVEHTTWNFITAKIFSELVDVQQEKIKEEDLCTLLITTLPQFLEMVFMDKIVFDVNKKEFLIGNKGLSLNSRNYNAFRNILKERNCISDVDDIDEDNPLNDMAKNLLERRRKYREKLKHIKRSNGDDDDSLTMCDLISIFAQKEKVSLSYVYDNYDMFQFNNQFNRLKISEDYQVNIKYLLAGAKSEDVKLQHWLSKIKKQED